jgi:hypothetical protein
MNNEFAEFHAQGFEETRDTLGREIITIGGARFSCDVALEPVSPSMEFGGERLSQWLHIELSKSLYPAQPASMLEIVYKARTFTVRRVAGMESNECAWTIDAMRTVRNGED